MNPIRRALLSFTKKSPGVRMDMLACLLAATLTCFGCATTGSYDASLNALVGTPEVDLVRLWGPPSRSFDSGGYRYLVYDSRNTTFLSGTATSYQPTSKASEMHASAIGGSPDLPIELACRTTFELLNAKVVSWSHTGNYCKSR